MSGVSGELTITLPDSASFATATPVNLRGEPAGMPSNIEDGKISFLLNAYAPASFMLH
jgi:hypothetical protein